MPRCFESGLLLGLRDLRLLDAEKAVTELIELRERILAIEQLIDRLGTRDAVERFDQKTRQMRTVLHHRLVSATIAAAYERRLELDGLFITIDEWHNQTNARRAERPRYPNHARSTGDSADGGSDE